MRSRRDATRVVYEILVIARGGASKTQIIHRANLNFHIGQPYLSFLVSKGMLQPKSSLGSVKSYELTGKGERLLRILTQVEVELLGLHHGLSLTGSINAESSSAPNKHPFTRLSGLSNDT